MNNIALVIVAAGSSTRMGCQIKKEYLPLNGGTVLSEVAYSFLKTARFSSLIIVIPSNHEKLAKNALFKNPNIQQLINEQNVKLHFVYGGKTRQLSVFNALNFLNEQTNKPDYVLIHDGARPFVSDKIIQSSIEYTIKYNASVPGLIPTDTQKEVDSNNFIKTHLIRKNLRSVQTPQGFLFTSIFEYHKKAVQEYNLNQTEYTDDTEIFDKYSDKKTFIFDGDPNNIKITYQKDLPRNNELNNNELNFKNNSKEKKVIRTGLGYDKHRLIENRKLLIGGIEIPFTKGEDGHSDGDAVLHAITDALLGASHLGDIGSYFPDTDEKYKNADSKELLKFAWNDVLKNGWQLENLDIVLLLQEPKFLPYRENVINSISTILGVENERIFIKAKTGEKLGDVGNGNSIEVFATCLLSK